MRAWSPIAILIAGLVLVLVAAGTGRAGTNLLANGELDTWNALGPADWAATGSWMQVSDPAIAGSAAQLAGTGQLSQTVPVSSGGSYRLQAHVLRIDTDSAVVLTVQFLDAAFMPDSRSYQTTVTTTGSFQAVDIDDILDTSGVGAWATIRIRAEGTGSVIIDEVSFEALQPATPEPTPTDTPDASTTGTVIGSTTATESPTTTQTARTTTPTKTLTPIAPPRTRTATPTPWRMPPRVRRRTPTPPPVIYPLVPQVGLIWNGDFEVGDGVPAVWRKQGGTLTMTTMAFDGDYAAMLQSDEPITRWIHQTVRVVPGRWYTARVQGRILSGSGEVYLRISWYQSADGSGSNFEQTDSAASQEHKWMPLDAGLFQAPEGAHSARVRLMYRPQSRGAALFDNAVMDEAEAPTPTPTPTAAWTPPEYPGLPGWAWPTAGPPSPVPTVTSTPTPPPATPTHVPTVVATEPPSSPSPTAPATTPIAPPLQRPGTAPTLDEPPAQTLAAPGAVLVSEILSDPVQSGRDNASEWIEIFNASDELVDMRGWSITDARGSDPMPAAILAPGAFVVIAGAEAVLPSDVPVLRVEDGVIGNGLNNAGDLLTITAADGVVIDSIAYGNESGAIAPAPAAGETAGRTVGGTWARTVRPTPGFPNEFPIEDDDAEDDDDSGTEPGESTPVNETPSAERAGSGDPAVIEAPAGEAAEAEGAPVDNLVANTAPQPGTTTVPVSSTRVEVASESGKPDPLAYAVFGGAVVVGALSGVRLLRRRLPFEISVRRRGE